MRDDNRLSSTRHRSTRDRHRWSPPARRPCSSIRFRCVASSIDPKGPASLVADHKVLAVGVSFTRASENMPCASDCGFVRRSGIRGLVAGRERV